MELMLVFRMLLRRWWLILIPVVVVAALTVPDFLGDSPATSGGYNTAIRYSAAQAFNLPERDGDYQDVWLASELAVNAFTEWVRNSAFRSELANTLTEQGSDLDLGPLGLSSDNERSVGVIYLSYPTADGLETIANGVIEVLATKNDDYFPQLGGEPAQVTLLDEVIITPGAPPIANRFGPFIKLGLGLLAGLGLAVLAEYLDPTLRTREDLEKEGLPVLASIPRYRR